MNALIQVELLCSVETGEDSILLRRTINMPFPPIEGLEIRSEGDAAVYNQFVVENVSFMIATGTYKAWVVCLARSQDALVKLLQSRGWVAD